MAIIVKTSAHIQLPGHPPSRIGLQDVVKFEKTAKRQIAIVREKGFRFPTNHKNLIYRVATGLQRLVPGKIGVRISVQKNTPPSKGLGSWASASASALATLNKLWGLGLSKKRLLEIGERVDPLIAEILKTRPKKSESGQKPWAIVAIPKLIEIDRDWIQKMATKQGVSPVSVAENHFPDLKMIKDALKKAGWDPVGLSGIGPAVAGFSEKRIGVAKIPKNIRSKLEFIWIGKRL